jgi:hypothetical protein
MTARRTVSVGVALLALGAFASTASAEPLSMTFTEDRANVGLQLSDDAMFEAPDTAPFEAQIGPAGESITAGELQVPEFLTHISDPINADVAVEFELGTISGTFIQATGALSLSGEAGGTLRANGKECTVSTTPSVLTLSTADNSGGTTNPRSGVPFTHGLTGAGSIAGQWTDMSATPVAGGDTIFCEDVEGQIEGPGGIWLEQAGDVAPPSAPVLTSTDPASPNAGGTPRIRGAAEAGATVRVYAGAGCTGTPVASGSAAELASPGIRVEVDEGVTAAFSATAADAAGNTSGCSAPISYRHLSEGTVVCDCFGPPPRCVVPKLAGKTLPQARTALTAAHCRVGKISKIKWKAKKGKKLGPVVVKGSSPPAGTILKAGSKVDLRIRLKPAKVHR